MHAQCVQGIGFGTLTFDSVVLFTRTLQELWLQDCLKLRVKVTGYYCCMKLYNGILIEISIAKLFNACLIYTHTYNPLTAKMLPNNSAVIIVQFNGNLE